MIAIEILDELHNFEAKSINDGLDLTCGGDELNHLLESSGPVLVQSDVDKTRSSILHQDCTLLIIAKLEKLLAEVIAEWVGHELNNMLVGLKPDHVNMVWVSLLKLLLEVAAPVLVLAEGVDLTTKGLQGDVGKSVHGCRAVSQYSTGDPASMQG
jgi:hypothetical protein